jgi:hypothetical protein
MSKKHEHLLIDRLMRAGVSFHPNTVVVNATEFISNNQPMITKPPIGKVCQPQFDYMFVEFRHYGKSEETEYQKASNKNTHAVYFMRSDWLSGEPSSASYEMIAFALNDFSIHKRKYRFFENSGDNREVFQNSEFVYGIDFDSTGAMLSEGDACWIMNDDDERCMLNGLNIFWNSLVPSGYENYVPEIPDDLLNPLWYYPALNAISQLHQKAEVELVDYPAQSLRRIERETGKEPSPFFMLKHQPVNQKRYKYINPPKKEVLEEGRPKEVALSQLPLTWVKGHFMTHPPTHPIKHFAGKTFFVEAHTRGDKKFGEVKKGYYIRQPKEKAAKPTLSTNMEHAKQDFDNFIRNTGSMVKSWGEKV